MDTSFLYVIIPLAFVLLFAGIAIIRIIHAKNHPQRTELPPNSAQKSGSDQKLASAHNPASLSTDINTPIDVHAVQMPDQLDQKAAQASHIDQGTFADVLRADAPRADAPIVDQPESVPGRMQRLRARLAKGGAFGKALLSILSRGDLSASDWEELEDTLIMADVGLESTAQIIDKLKEEAKVRGTSDPAVIRDVLREELVKLVDPAMDRSLAVPSHQAQQASSASPASADSAGLSASPTSASSSGSAVSSGSGLTPSVILMVGVNGTGKTTTAGKLARLLVADGHSVLLGAADTFRAAAADQLETWGERVGVPVVRADREGADPASVAFDAVRVAAERGTEVVIVDTAGRLQNKAGLMDELGKIKRVIEKKAPVSEVLLVLDATTGQNGLQQAKVFAQVTGLTGIILTKLDGTAKGGIVMAVQREIGVPVKFVGLGEGVDDLAPFDPHDFVDSLLDAPAAAQQ